MNYRKIKTQNLVIRSFYCPGDTSTIEIDFKDGIFGFHNMRDMEAVSNCICSKLAALRNGVYDPQSGSGKFDFNNNNIAIIADSVCAEIDLQAECTKEELAQLQAMINSFLIENEFTYNESDHTLNHRGVDFGSDIAQQVDTPETRIR